MPSLSSSTWSRRFKKRNTNFGTFTPLAANTFSRSIYCFEILSSKAIVPILLISRHFFHNSPKQEPIICNANIHKNIDLCTKCKKNSTINNRPPNNTRSLIHTKHPRQTEKQITSAPASSPPCPVRCGWSLSPCRGAKSKCQTRQCLLLLAARAACALEGRSPLCAS